jgi:uncharacterized protein (TIGR03437 family)
VDVAGDVFVGDAGNNRIRKLPRAGTISTVAGNGAAGFSGDGGPATSATLYSPDGVAVDAGGDIFIADPLNNRIRKVTPAGTISTLAGSGTAGFNGDGGPATSAELNSPEGVAVDGAGDVFIADTHNLRIRKVTPAGTISTVAGSGTQGFSGDGGPATSAELNYPSGIAVDGSGNLFIADSGNQRIRKLTPIASPAPSINSGGVLNSASYASGAVAPGSIAAVFGSFPVTSPAMASGAPWPTSLGGLSVQFGATSAPLYYASGSQTNLQVPWELSGQTQTMISAAANGQTGAAQTVSLASFAPGIFSMNGQGTGQGAIVDAITGRLLDSFNPAVAGSTYVSIYCTGLGPVTNQPASGAASPSNPLAKTTTTPIVGIGNIGAQVLFSGLAPGFVGEYQVNALVPAGVTPGNSVPVSISIGGVYSNTVTIAVQCSGVCPVNP